MKQVQIRQEFDYPLQTLLEAREERYKHLDKFPELKNVSIISEEQTGDILKQTRHISIGDSMPAALVTILPQGASTLVETSEFHAQTHEHTFRVAPGGGLDNLFVVTGSSRYFALDGDRAGRDYEIEIVSKAFLVSAIVEGAIADLYTKNIEKDRQSILKFIEILAEEKQKQTGESAPEDAGGG